MKTRTRRASKRPTPDLWNPRPLALALALVGTTAYAQLPTGFDLIQGSVNNPSTAGNTMSIRQNSDRAIVHWNNFSIGEGKTVRFLQPGASSIMLNRVLPGGDMSRISGELSANGKVFLINPTGVLFGAGSRVDTGGLVASTLDIADADFMAGRFKFALEPGNTANVTNLGKLSAPGSTIALLAATVVNGGEGRIEADGGTVGLVSAQKVSLDFQGDGLTTFRFERNEGLATGAVTNELGATLQANGGRVAVLADASDAARLVVNQKGTMRAGSVSMRNGEILLGATGGGEVEIGGTLDANGQEAGTTGGRIAVAADKIEVLSGAKLDASGADGGGTLELESTRTAILQDAVSLRADALAQGDGGSIDIDANRGGLYVAGTLSANGAADGAGGQVNTSGAVVMVGTAEVSASGAGSGANGAWHLSSAGDVYVRDELAPRPVDGVSAETDDSTVYSGALGSALGRNTDVTVTASGFDPNGGRGQSGNVFFDSANVVKREGRKSALRVNAMRNISAYDGSIVSENGALDIEFNADSSGTTTTRWLTDTSSDPVEESGGNIYLGDVTLDTRGGDIRLFGQSDAENGHASGGTAIVRGYASRESQGISIYDSTIRLCADDACSAGGSFHAAGRGTTEPYTWGSDFEMLGGLGIGLTGTHITAGKDIVLTGEGGIGASGVSLYGPSEGAESGGLKATGNVRVTGTSQDAGVDNIVIVTPVDAGVTMEYFSIAAGGDVEINGTGADLSSLTESEEARKLLDGRSIDAADGIRMFQSTIAAGNGHKARLNGTAGSDGIRIPDDETDYAPIAAHGIRIEKSLTFGSTPDNAIDIGASGGAIELIAHDSDILLSSQGSDPVYLDAGSPSGQGGEILLSGRNIALMDNTRIAADGETGGGRIQVLGSGAVAMNNGARLSAIATGASGNGGQIALIGDQGLRAFGTLQARGTGAGKGGRIETSGGAFDLRGIRADAGSDAGAAGTWVIDPYDVDIVHGTGTGGLPSNPFDPVAASTVQDADINSALDAGTSVTIGTGAGGDPGEGGIFFQPGVEIRRTTGTAALDLSFDAHNRIQGSDFLIESTTGPLNLAFNSDANGTQPFDSSINFQNATLTTNGGSIRMYGQGDPVAGNAPSSRSPAISLDDSALDTRVGQSDDGAGGDVIMRGAGDGPTSVQIAGGSIRTSTGSVVVRGVSGGAGAGVTFSAGNAGNALVATTTGDISITGIGGNDGSFFDSGVVMTSTQAQTRDGTIDVRGLAQGSAGDGSGVVMESASLVVEGDGRAWVSGQAEGSGAGIDLQGGTSSLSAHAIDGGSQTVVLRADNDGSTDALRLDASIRSGTAINLRPGGVDAAGDTQEHLSTAISVGNDDNGFSVSSTDLSQLQAPTLIIGSDSHASDIAVTGPVTTTNNLTLQNEGGGAIAIGDSIAAAALALLASGDITQTGSAGLTTGALLAQSANGGVQLTNPGNSASTLAGSAATDFRYTNAGGLSVGSTTPSGMDIASNAPVSRSVDGITADRAIVQALAGDIAIDSAVSATTATTLQADAGAIQLNQALQSGTVGLFAQSDITQAAGAGIAAEALLARSSAGEVALTDAGNNVRTLAGSAATDFRYRDDNAVTIGSVTAPSHDTSGALQETSLAGIQAGNAAIATTAGDIVVAETAAATGFLTLQADSGAIAVNAQTQADTVALLADGDIAQSAAGAIAADTLLVRSTNGNARLAAASNDVRTLAGTAAGNLHYAGEGDLVIGSASARSLDASGTVQNVSASGLAGTDVIAQARSGSLSVQAASAASNGLSLQADTTLDLGQAVQGATVALLANGDIGQTGAGTIDATQLLARSTGGGVRLDNPANRAASVAGGAGGAFLYTNADALRIATVTAASLDTGGALAATSVSGIDAASSVVRTQAGDLTLAADVTGGTADLVAAERFQNPDGATIGTTGSWRVWADTWQGEQRGGLAGSGTLPNLYNRAYGAAVGDSDNHFIYRQQPTVVVTLDSAARPAGQPNPPLGYTVSGLILGDTGAGISGAAGTSATASSPAGSYAVTASTPFVSAEGYAVQVVPGLLTVNSLQTPALDIHRDMPTTYLYDRNIAPVAMCFATGPLAGDRVEQTGDVLSREWARIRTRPNLTNCVSTDRTNACSNF